MSTSILIIIIIINFYIYDYLKKLLKIVIFLMHKNIRYVCKEQWSFFLLFSNIQWLQLKILKKIITYYYLNELYSLFKFSLYFRKNSLTLIISFFINHN